MKTIKLPAVLSVHETEKYETCKAEIKNGLGTFVKVGAALIQIRDEQLYRADHETFEQFCRHEYGMTGSRAYQLCDASMVATNIQNSTSVEKPKNEAQARPLAKLPKAKQIKAWKAASRTAAKQNRNIRARDVEEAVAKIAPRRTENRISITKDKPFLDAYTSAPVVPSVVILPNPVLPPETEPGDAGKPYESNGQIAYEAYCGEGNLKPGAWDKLDSKEQAQWERAATAVMTHGHP